VRRRLTIDPWLPLLTLTLVVVGLVMIYSASAPRSMRTFDNSWHFAARQGIWAALGMLALGVGTLVDYRRWQEWSVPLLGLVVVALAATLIPGIGISAGGARRWLGAGGFTLQPSEAAKFVCIVYMSGYLARHQKLVRGGSSGAAMRPMLVIGTILALILVEPDLGNAVAIAAVVGSLLFVGGIGWGVIGGLSLLGVAGLALAVYLEPYRMTRLTSYLDPWADPTGSGFQVVQSFLAFGSGGIAGLGLGEGRQKMFYLPEAHTDFIFSVIGEELGLIGAFAVVALFAAFAWRGLRISRACSSPFGGYLALGLTLMVVLQALINMGVSVGILPNKGLPLPFVSYGGSSLLLNLFAVGVLINISKDRYGRRVRGASS